MRCGWCGSTRHDATRCAGRHRELAVALADEESGYPDDNHGQFDHPERATVDVQAARRRAVA